jgi:adenylate cyclase
MELERPEHHYDPQYPTYQTYPSVQQPHNKNGHEQPQASVADGAQVSSEHTPVVSPQVRVPVRVKITLPYLLLALLVALAGAYIVSRVILDSVEERFTNQLIEAGQLAADQMVQEESRLLETSRLVAHTQGLIEAIAKNDAEQLHRLTLPIAANYKEEAIEILNVKGVALLSLRHQSGQPPEDYAVSQGERTLARLKFVQQVLAQHTDLAGDKFAGLAKVAGQHYFYVASPIVDEKGDLIGVVMAGKSLSTLVRQIKRETLTQATLYNLEGQPLASTLPALTGDNYALPASQVTDMLARQETYSGIRDLTTGSIDYSEIIGPWQVRDGQDLGLMGIGLAQSLLVHTRQFTRFQIFFLVTITFLVIITVGLYLASRITHPLLRMVQASTEVAQGNLSVQVDSAGNDEVAVLSHAFNQMVSGLREGSLYRDLLGRTVSPQVREQLRQSFASGILQLEGQNALATILISDIRDFTVLSEKEDPITILNWLNEYFGELVPIIAAHGGVVNGFQGDALLAFFGILPRPLPSQESAERACQAAIDMLAAVERLNARRVERGDPPLVTGIGINTGVVIAGGLGSTDRLHYTVIGDTVNTTQRLEDLTRDLGESGVIISQQTMRALEAIESNLHLEPLGAKMLKGKSEPLPVYRLHPFTKTLRVMEATL